MKKYVLMMMLLWVASGGGMAADFIVENGAARAEIVMSENAPGSVSLAADELQKYIAKISGAKLPIVTNNATANVPVQVYVGACVQADRQGINAAGLEDGAFRMKTAGKELFLLGNDSHFTVKGVAPRSPADMAPIAEKWEKASGGLWQNPGRSFLNWSYNKKYDIWDCSSRGTLNAVYEFLRTLGVRWYMPGDLGEVVPEMKTIPLPEMDKVVKPAFLLRFMSFNRFTTAQEDHILWALRLGLNNPYGYWVAHGLREMTSRKEMREAHPEFYAVFKGERQPQSPHVCYSSEALLKENVRFVRALYDIYDFKMVSVMPEDGFTFACECPECLAQATPERTSAGKYSDYIWNYVNRVAKEVYKTHPDRLVCCCAYSTYRLPPEKIKKFSPNVVVGLVGGRSPQIEDPEGRKAVRELQQAWAAKTDAKIFIFENYPFTTRMKYFVPRLFPHGIATSMREVKDISMGESIWMGESRGLHAPEFNHLNYYVTARLYWDPDSDPDKLLDEYYRLFYGPATEAMKAFVEHCEAHAGDMRVNPHPSRKKEVLAMLDKTFTLLDEARAKTGEGTVYAGRINKLGEWLVTLKDMRDQIARGRGNVPEAAIPDLSGKSIKLDGTLDDPAWQGLPEHALKEIVKGGEPASKTFFKAFWADNSLYLGFRCEDPDMANLNITCTEDDDARAWRGDVMELLIETDQHSFYQLVINPAGALVDLDRNVTNNDLSWDSMASVKSARDAKAWTLEVKIPVLAESDDPLHNLVGHKPTPESPWHFNFCRQRMRGDDGEFSAFSPTGAKFFAELMKFAKLYVK